MHNKDFLRENVSYLRSYISQKASLKGLLWCIFADHQDEYIVSLSHCFFLRIKVLHLASLQRNL